MCSAHETQQSAVSSTDDVISRVTKIPTISQTQWLHEKSPPRILWANRGELEIAGAGATAVVRTTAHDRFTAIHEQATALFGSVDHTGPAQTRPRLFGGFSFDSLHTAQPPWRSFPTGYFILPEWLLVHDGTTTWLVKTARSTETTPSELDTALATEAERIVDRSDNSADNEDVPAIRNTTITPPKSTWMKNIEQARTEIQAGRLSKVVLATEMTVNLESPLSIPTILRRFRDAYSDCYRFLIQPTNGPGFFGPPPERLIAVEDGTATTEALAGSAPRAETDAADRAYARSLRNDPKTTHEQQLVVDTIAETLSTFGEIEIGDRTVRSFNNIQHLHTPIRAELTDQYHILELVAQLHPSPAVGGRPHDVALSLIRELEPFQRGWYAAPIGWFDQHGDGEFAVGIRSGLADREHLQLYAGNGIVADSDPAAEWEEITPKFQPILDALQ